MSNEKPVAVVVGVGPGLGKSIAAAFAEEGMQVAVAARTYDRIQSIATEIGAKGYECDATEEVDVRRLFEKVADDLGEPQVVVYNAGLFFRRSILETAADDFERSWRANCYGGFLVGREAARRMVKQDGGSILFTGATASLRGSAGFAPVATGKFGLRALAQSMARELQPKNIHVATVIVDGQIEDGRPAGDDDERVEDDRLDPAAIANAFVQLHHQPRSAWTLELDLRPWAEKF